MKKKERKKNQFFMVFLFSAWLRNCARVYSLKLYWQHVARVCGVSRVGGVSHVLWCVTRVGACPTCSTSGVVRVCGVSHMLWCVPRVVVLSACVVCPACCRVSRVLSCVACVVVCPDCCFMFCVSSSVV